MTTKRLVPVQCSTGPFWAFELERAMDALAEAGFTSIELMVTRDTKTHEPDIPLKLAEERGLEIASVHGPFLVITKSVWGMDPIGKIERGIEMCKAFGAETLVVHPPFLWERGFANWVTERAEQSYQETGVAVAVETMYPKWVAGRKLRGYRWLRPAELVAEAPHVVIDTSHLSVSREDILKAYETLAPHLVHIHLSDNAGDGKDGHLELGHGILPLERFLDELRRTKYAGAISLELSVGRYVQRPRELVEMLARNRVYVEERLKGRRRISKGLPRT
ncbi:MAG: sugar phosphate isomerase/epimerase [Actinobacteria bacterium]|jgi:sugar phosphate isomerase/epimerase|nr:sugar phosphate isomerase/epimerase [Actinomycetota bacterium]